ncbi:helix-turn-helix domain protein [archaeon]|nr:helix-turn-helix domain protein [archaeon]
MTFVRGGGDMEKNIEEDTNTPVDYYASLFPEEIRDAVKAFDHKIRQAIIAALLMKDELSFTELRDLLKLSNSRIAPHLDMLVSGALIENVIREGRIERKYSFYRPSPYGQKFVKSLIDFIMLPESVMSPNIQQVEMQSISIEDIKELIIVPESRRYFPTVKIKMLLDPANLSKQIIKT